MFHVFSPLGFIVDIKLAHLPVRTFQVVAGSQTCHSFRLSGLSTRQHVELYLLVLLDIKKEIPIRSS